MTNKEFAEKNAGKYFPHRGEKVRVVGYCAYNAFSIIVSVPAKAKHIGWNAQALEDGDVFVIRSRASKYWYVEQCQLMTTKKI